MAERWKDVPGFEGKYRVSNEGRVRSLNYHDGHRNVTGRVLKPGRMKAGHLMVMLGRKNNRLVHKLVMLAFKGPCPDGLEVFHKDSVPWNNKLRNLKYGTRSENVKMDYALGIRKPPVEWIYSSNGKRQKDWGEYAARHG